MKVEVFNKNFEIDCIEENWERKPVEMDMDCDSYDEFETDETFETNTVITMDSAEFENLLKNVSGMNDEREKMLKTLGTQRFVIMSDEYDFVLLCNTEGFDYIRYAQVVPDEILDEVFDNPFQYKITKSWEA